MTKDETLEALTQEIWDELPFGSWWKSACAADQKDAVAETLRKSATLATLIRNRHEPTAYNSAPTGKMLTPDELRAILKACASKTATWPEVDRLKDHIAALEGGRERHKADNARPGHESCPDNPCPGHHPYCEGVGRDSAPPQPIRLMERDTLSARDEFAKAAMQAFLADMWRGATEATVSEFATRAYRMADAMLSARGGVVDITPEQEKDWETEARADAVRQMRAACLAAVQTYLDGIGLEHDVPMWREIEHAIQQAKP